MKKLPIECQSCKSHCLIPILDLGVQPWCNNFTKIPSNWKTSSLISKMSQYPLRLIFCVNCKMLQLDTIVSKNIMFSEHVYLSGTTKTLANHFMNIAMENKTDDTLKLQNDDLIVDIGGNDGTQLLQYKTLGFTNLLNVESAHNIADIARNNGIGTETKFFNEKFVDEYLKDKKAKLILAAGVFFHLEELHSVIRGIKKLLDESGAFVVQCMYWNDIMHNLQFDAIYHEHLVYYNLESLKNLLEPYNLSIYDAYRSPIHGGSVMVKIGHTEHLHGYETQRLKTLKETDSVSLSDLLTFSEEVQKRRYLLRDMLTNIKNAGKKIYGYGAPARGNTLLNYMQIDNSMIDKMVEINPLKVGLYTPGSDIPIIHERDADLPDYYLVLAWNFFDEMSPTIQALRKKGVKFIIPFPEIKIH